MWQKTIWQKYMNGRKLRNCLMYKYRELDSKWCFIHLTDGIDNNRSMCKGLVPGNPMKQKWTMHELFFRNKLVLFEATQVNNLFASIKGLFL